MNIIIMSSDCCCHCRRRYLRSSCFNVVALMVMVMVMMMMMIGAVIATATTTATQQEQLNKKKKKKYFLMGLPKSGSYYIHEFVNCMNDKILKVHEQEQQLSSAHYCCDPNRSSTTATTTTGSRFTTSSLETTSYFPCPQHMTPCGTCMHNHFLTSHSEKDKINKNAKWFNDACGNYDVYSNYHVEVSNSDSVSSGFNNQHHPFSYFLPQHYTMPYLIVNNDNEQDATEAAVADEDATTVWILNQRSSSERWAHHVHHWYSITNRIFNSFNISYYSNDDTSTVPLVPPEDIPITTEVLQDELDISFERMNNYTDYQRRINELQSIYEYHTKKVQHFVQQYNNNRRQGSSKIQLHIVNINDPTDDDNSNESEPKTATTIAHQLVQIFFDSSISTHDDIMIRQCWKYNSTQYEQDYTLYDLNTTFRATA